MRSCSVDESRLILGLEFLHIIGDCSLIVWYFFLMLVETCCVFLSANLCVVLPAYGASDRHEYILRVFVYIFFQMI